MSSFTWPWSSFFFFNSQWQISPKEMSRKKNRSGLLTRLIESWKINKQRKAVTYFAYESQPLVQPERHSVLSTNVDRKRMKPVESDCLSFVEDSPFEQAVLRWISGDFHRSRWDRRVFVEVELEEYYSQDSPKRAKQQKMDVHPSIWHCLLDWNVASFDRKNFASNSIWLYSKFPKYRSSSSRNELERHKLQRELKERNDETLSLSRSRCTNLRPRLEQ